jgi:hypothetical protein
MRPVDMLGLAYIDRRHADSSALGALATLGGSEALRLVAGRTVGGGQRETVCRIRKQEGLQVMKTVCKRRPLGGEHAHADPGSASPSCLER